MTRLLKETKKHWGQEQKLEAVKTYLALGDLRLTATMLKIPEPTMRMWKASPWWLEVTNELKLQDELVVSTRLKRIIEKTMDVVEDRLEHGDFVYDQKTGAMRRKPVNAKDAAKIGLDYDSRRDVLNNRQTGQSSEEAIDDKLNKLALKFAALVGAKPIDTSQALDVESKVVPDNGDVSEIRNNDEQEHLDPVGEEEQS